jgi:uncharacterized protein YyaL (SSP411 family)
MSTARQPNRLINASSLYLQQHAWNPVNWFEWGDEAFSLARQENKPVLVSIGYSACHWCHVMERECFENPELASLMNKHLVCIKVDREERPDIDQLYMDAVQAMGLNGGWPLNVFVTPHQQPFFGGTYFPPSRWKQLIEGIAQAWAMRREEILKSAEELTQHLQKDVFTQIQSPANEQAYNPHHAYNKLCAALDMRLGGLAKAPKFVLPAVWRWLFHYGYLAGHQEAINHALFTLHHIAAGGIYDHIGGGFARYAVDEKWFVPHFEKMLYDNAQLIELYSEAWMISGEERFREVVAETITWLQREMHHPNGGFFSAIDADSEGTEGKFYTWTYREIAEALGSEAPNWLSFFHVLPHGNWEEARNILYRTPRQPTPSGWCEARNKLLNLRNLRPRPACDQKIITAWNAMTITGLCTAYRAFANAEYLNLALRCFSFLENNLIREQTLLHGWNEKPLAIPGFLDDYACTIRACLALHQCTLNERFLLPALRLTEEVIRHFSDPASPFFFYSSSTAEKLIARKKEMFDNVIPASNSLMAENLLVLGQLLERHDFTEKALQMTRAVTALTQEEPVYMANWGIAQLRQQGTRCQVVIAGNDAVRKQLQQHFHPLVLYARATDTGLIPLAAQKHTADTAIFVCVNNTCLAPVSQPEQAIEELTRQAKAFGHHFD